MKWLMTEVAETSLNDAKLHTRFKEMGGVGL